MGKKISLEEEIKKTEELLASLRKKQAEQQGNHATKFKIPFGKKRRL